MLKLFMLLTWTIVAAATFGIWMHSIAAGLFVFSALVVLDQRSY